MPSPLDAGGTRPEERESRGTPAPASSEEALRRLEQRLDRATEAAERLMAQVAAEAARAGAAGLSDPAPAESQTAGADTPTEHPPTDLPPAGWQTAGDARDATSELDPLVALVQAMRDLIPPELQERLIAALREMLLALRALIDWYLERIEHRQDQGPEIQDIPIQ